MNSFKTDRDPNTLTVSWDNLFPFYFIYFYFKPLLPPILSWYYVATANARFRCCSRALTFHDQKKNFFLFHSDRKLFWMHMVVLKTYLMLCEFEHFDVIRSRTTIPPLIVPRFQLNIAWVCDATSVCDMQNDCSSDIFYSSFFVRGQFFCPGFATISFFKSNGIYVANESDRVHVEHRTFVFFVGSLFVHVLIGASCS